jgi:hypothetical protein
VLPFNVGRESEIGIAIRYELDGPGIISRWVRYFSLPSRPTVGPTHPPVKLVPFLFPGDKAAGAWYWPPYYHVIFVPETKYLFWSSGNWKCTAHTYKSDAVAQLVKVLRHKPEGRGCHWNFSLTWSSRLHYGPGVYSQQWVPCRFPGGRGVKAAGA